MFVFRRSRLSSCCKFQQAFNELWFQYQFSFQILCRIIWICPMCSSYRDWSEDWVVISAIVQFSNYVGSKTQIHNEQLSNKHISINIQTFKGVAFPSSRTLQSFEYILVARAPLFLSSSQKAEALFTHTSCNYAKQQEEQKGSWGESMRIYHILLRLQLLQSKRKVQLCILSLSPLWCCCCHRTS